MSELPVLIQLYLRLVQLSPIPVAVRSRALVCGRSVVGIADSKPVGSMDVFFFYFCVLSGRDLFDGPITHPEESY